MPPATTFSPLLAADACVVRYCWRAMGKKESELTNGASSVAKWKGVSVKGGRVSSLLWMRLALVGSIPEEICALTKLEKLDLHGNMLSGPIPSAISSLACLRECCLDDNSLTGCIPAEIATLRNLDMLYLHKNALSGEIPAELAELTSLTELYLHSNNFIGPLPPQIGNLTALTVLASDPSQLQEVPSSIANLTNLEDLNLGYSQLDGQPVDSIHLPSNWLRGYDAVQTFLATLASSDRRGGSGSGPGSLCIVCLDAVASAQLAHSNGTSHQTVCEACAEELQRRGDPCPTCREEIKLVIFKCFTP